MMDCSKIMILVPKNTDQENRKEDIAIADKASKTYVDQENGKQDTTIVGKADKRDVLLHDDSVNMSGNLNMNSKSIIHVKDISNLPQ